MDGIDGNFERRLEPEKAAGPGESLTEGIMASSLPPINQERLPGSGSRSRAETPRPGINPSARLKSRQTTTAYGGAFREGFEARILDIWWVGRAGDYTARPLESEMGIRRSQGRGGVAVVARVLVGLRRV